VEEKIVALEQQIEFLVGLRRRLEHFSRQTSKKLPCPPMKPSEICCLIEGLPSQKAGPQKGGARDAKALVAATRRVSGTGH
jgi:hypothetical protein